MADLHGQVMLFPVSADINERMEGKGLHGFSCILKGQGDHDAFMGGNGDSLRTGCLAGDRPPAFCKDNFGNLMTFPGGID